MVHDKLNLLAVTFSLLPRKEYGQAQMDAYQDGHAHLRGSSQMSQESQEGHHTAGPPRALHLPTVAQ